MHRYTDDCDDFVNQRPSRSRSISAEYRHERSMSADMRGGWGGNNAMYTEWAQPNVPDLGVKIKGMEKFGRARSSSVSSRRSVTGRRGVAPHPQQPLRHYTMPMRPQSAQSNRGRRPSVPYFVQQRRQPRGNWTPRRAAAGPPQQPRYQPRRPATAPATRRFNPQQQRQNNNKKGRKGPKPQKTFMYQWEGSIANKTLLSLLSLTSAIEKSKPENTGLPKLMEAKETALKKLPEALAKLAKMFNSIATSLGVSDVSFVEKSITGVQTDSLENMKTSYNKLKGLLNHLSKEELIANAARPIAKNIAKSNGVTLPNGFDTYHEIVTGIATVEIKSIQQFTNIAPFILIKQPDIRIMKGDKPHNRSKKEFMELITEMLKNGHLKIKDMETLRINQEFNKALEYVMHLTYNMVDNGKHIKEARSKTDANMSIATMSTRQKMLLTAYDGQPTDTTTTIPSEKRMTTPPTSHLQSAADRDTLLFSMMFPQKR